MSRTSTWLFTVAIGLALCAAACELGFEDEEGELSSELAPGFKTCEEYYQSINYSNCQKDNRGQKIPCKSATGADNCPAEKCDKRCNCCLKPGNWCSQPYEGQTLYRVVQRGCDPNTKECPSAPAASGGWYTDATVSCSSYPDLCTWEGNDGDKDDCLYTYKITVKRLPDGSLNCKSPCDGPENAGSPGECGGETCKKKKTYLCGPGTFVSKAECGTCGKKAKPGTKKQQGKKKPAGAMMVQGATGLAVCVACEVGSDPQCQPGCCVDTAEHTITATAECGTGTCGECDPTTDAECEPCADQCAACDPETDPGCSYDSSCGCSDCPYEKDDPRYEAVCVDASVCAVPHEEEVSL